MLFVCTGNICRSPTAERLARAFADEHGLGDLTASSAGSRAVAHPRTDRAVPQLRSESNRSGCRTQWRRQVDLRRPHPGTAAPGSVVVNADEIAKQRWPDAVASHAYDVAQVAAATRSKLIELRRPFIAETVFSHRSELDLIRAASDVGYTVVLHVRLVPEELAVERVKQRVQADVARSLWALVAHAVVNRPVRASTTTLGSTAHGSSPR